MAKKTLQNKEKDKRVFYGPHACEVCGKLIVKASNASGGEAFDQPQGGAYPNTVWEKHKCLSSEEQIAKLRKQVKDLEGEIDRNRLGKIIIEKEIWPRPYYPTNPYPLQPVYPIWCNTETGDNKYLCNSSSSIQLLGSGTPLGQTDYDLEDAIMATADERF